MEKFLKKKDICIPIFHNGYLVIVLSNDVDKVNEMFGDDRSDIYASAYFGLYEKDKKTYNGYYIVLNPFNDFSDITPGTISHEAFHISSMLFDRINIKADHNNDEAQAYFLEWVVDEVYGFLKDEGYSF